MSKKDKNAQLAKLIKEIDLAFKNAEQFANDNDLSFYYGGPAERGMGGRFYPDSEKEWRQRDDNCWVSSTEECS